MSYQVSIREVNASEPLLKHREIPRTTSKPLFQSVGGKNTAGDLFTGCMVFGV